MNFKAKDYLILFLAIAALFIAKPVWAEENYSGLLADENLNDRYNLLAQADGDDSYDPFADYSEFEESSEEEADINFFRNGRFFTMGFVGGYRLMTENMGDIYKPGSNFGIFLAYFFDLRFALQLAFLTGDHQIGFKTPAGTTVRGNAAMTNIGIDLKYYLNTQNVTRGLAQLNPYIIGGFSQVYRTATVSGETAFSKEGAMAFDLGAGIELPMMQNKMYFGGQLLYQMVNFKDENSEIIISGNEQTGIYPTGDMLTFSVILGINF